MDATAKQAHSVTLLANIKAAMPGLRDFQKSLDDRWGTEDGIYRFYHHSFKVYGLQGDTGAIVAGHLTPLNPQPGTLLNQWFLEIYAAGTGKDWEVAHNTRWLQETRPIVEAYFHAKYFLDMAIKYGDKLEEAPLLLPSGWAALLYLYNIR